jgi:hypothetical protein
MTITSGCIAWSVRQVSWRVSPFFTLDADTLMLMTSALNRFPASSKDVRVRVDAS